MTSRGSKRNGGRTPARRSVEESLLAALSVGPTIAAALLLPAWAVLATVAATIAAALLFIRPKRTVTIAGATTAVVLLIAAVIVRTQESSSPSRDPSRDLRSIEAKIDDLLKQRPQPSATPSNPTATPSEPSGSSTAGSLPRALLASLRTAMVEYINEYRARHGRRPVRESKILERSAQGHADDMLANAYFSHISPSGEGLTDRNREYTRGAKGSSLGEAIEWAASSNLHQLLRAWVQSPAHRSIILNPRYRDAGVGVAVGKFQGIDDATILSLTLGRRG